MDFSFVNALRELGPNAGFRIANEARTPANYLLASILPERKIQDYHVERGKMIVRSTRAGLTAMDSPYPSGGYVEVDTFSENTLKIAIEVGLPEASLRRLQAIMAQVTGNGGSGTQALVQEALNFFDKVIMQSHFDMAEYLRGQALTTGGIAFTQNGKTLAVSYGVPAGNILTPRSGNDAYEGSTSKWWTDVRAAQEILRGGMTTILTNSVTANSIIYNSVNNVRVLDSGNGFVRLARLENSNNVVRPSEDKRDFVTLVLYDQEGDLANPAAGTVENVKFVPDGKVVFIGKNQIRGYEVGQGTTPDPDNDLTLGYTHLAPTVEGGGVAGRWGDMFVPENAPWRIVGRAAANLLPVILAPTKLVIAETTIA